MGDLDGSKGLYLINAVDEHPIRVHRRRGGDLRTLPAARARGTPRPLPLRRHGLPRRQRVAQRRAGSEYINRQVARLLAKLHAEFTKSRARHSNDNALVEGKNANVVRRWLGHVHIPRRFAPLVHDGQGRVRRRYPHDQVATPYERFRRIDDAERFLKPGVAFADLDRAAHAASDLAALREVNRARAELFRTIGLASDAQPAA